MPAYDAIPNRVMRELAASESWRRWFPEGRANEWRSHALEFYRATLARRARHLDLWATDYFQVMPHLGAIVEWYKSTGLRPYLDRIADADEQDRFLDDYKARLSPFFGVAVVLERKVALSNKWLLMSGLRPSNGVFWRQIPKFVNFSF